MTDSIASPRSQQVSVRLPVTLTRRLEQTAQRENNGLAAVMRRLLTRAVDAETPLDRGAA
jgi:predicted transcriptional regulator